MLKTQITDDQQDSERGNSVDQNSRNPHRALYRGHYLSRAAVLRDFVSGVIARSVRLFSARRGALRGDSREPELQPELKSVVGPEASGYRPVIVEGASHRHLPVKC